MTVDILPRVASPGVWQDGVLRAPENGGPLTWDTPHSLTDGVRRYPVLDGIPFLRTNRDARRLEVLAHLDGGRTEAGLALLLADRDDWARGEGPRHEDLLTLIRTEPDLTLHAAMQLLAYGPVSNYFAYRWSDPTFLSGLKLLEIGLPGTTAHVVEIACGIGHYLRELTTRGIAATGVDVVFSKLWLAKKFVAPQALLVCADAASGLPFTDDFADGAFCHDAFYFLAEKKRVADEMMRVSSGPILIGHAHNREADNFSSGEPWSVDEYAALVPGASVYDDAELTRAFIEARAPRPAASDDVRKCAALSFAHPNLPSAPPFNFVTSGGGTSWSVNPLLLDGNGAIGTSPRWPSDRYEAEYAPLSAYLHLTQEESAELSRWQTLSKEEQLAHRSFEDWSRRRILLQLPARWSLGKAAGASLAA